MTHEIGRNEGGIFEGQGYRPSLSTAPRGVGDVAHTDIPTAPGYTPFYESGRTAGILAGSDPGDLEFALENPTQWIRVSPGDYLPPVDRPFKRFFVRRPKDTPADGGVSRLAVSDDRFPRGATPPPKNALAGASNLTVYGAATAGKVLLVKANVRRHVTIACTGATSPTGAWGPDANGASRHVRTGYEKTLDYTGPIYVDDPNNFEAHEEF